MRIRGGSGAPSHKKSNYTADESTLLALLIRALQPGFSNNCKVTAVTNTKQINRNLLCKETSFVCYTSSVLRASRHMKQKENYVLLLRSKLKITKIEPN